MLTADFVAKRRCGKWAREIGSKNPGMANIGSLFGTKAALEVLGGDILKTIVAVVVSYLLFPENWPLVALWAGLGVTLGHNFPFWTKFHGGKGVTTTCSAIILFDPIWGIICSIAGFAVVAFTKQLCFGAFAIPLLFIIPTVILHGPEATIIVVALTVLMAIKHGKPMINAIHGTEPQTDVLAKVRKSR